MVYAICSNVLSQGLSITGFNCTGYLPVYPKHFGTAILSGGVRGGINSSVLSAGVLTCRKSYYTSEDFNNK
jgi:hypothetical protein